jgi:hypothetical protein
MHTVPPAPLVLFSTMYYWMALEDLVLRNNPPAPRVLYSTMHYWMPLQEIVLRITVHS